MLKRVFIILVQNGTYLAEEKKGHAPFSRNDKNDTIAGNVQVRSC